MPLDDPANPGGELRRIVTETVPVLRALTEEQAAQPYREGGWSRKQIVGHLLDSAANNHHRFIRGQAENPLVMPGYQQDHWVQANHYAEYPWQQLVEFWSAYNYFLAHVLESVPESAQAHETRVGNYGTLKLGYLMTDYVVHLQHHVDQLVETPTSSAVA